MIEADPRCNRDIGERSARAARRGRSHAVDAAGPAILRALREIEAGNDRLGSLIGRLVADGAEFEELMNSSKDQMTQLGRSAAILPGVASRLQNAGAATLALAQSDEATLDALFSRHIMERERDVHRQFLKGFGLTLKESTKGPTQARADDGLLLF